MMNSNDANLSHVINNNILKAGHKCIFCIKAGLVEDWVITSRILALIENQNNYGLLIFITSNSTISSATDLTLENALPVNDHFKCEIDASTVFASADLYVKITYEGKKYLFELPYHTSTNQFVAEVHKAIELHMRRSTAVSFEWLQKYFIQKETLMPLKKGSDLSLKFEDNFADMMNLSDKRDPFETTPFKPLNPFAATKIVESTAFDISGHNQQNTITEWIDTNSANVNSVLNSFTNSVGNSSFYSDIESPDNFSNIPRHSIATGAVPLAARESVIRAKMTMQEEKYIDMQSFRIFIGTWNVNGQIASTSLGEYWLACDPSPPDFYAIGFQELDLSKEAFLFNDTPKEEMWYKSCRHGLHPKANYELVKLVRLIGMMLIVFVKKELKQFVTNVSAETVGTGILGKMGNKGGVAIRFDFHSSSICFVNCHLAAHVEEYERRNQDYNEICSRLIFNQFKPPKCIKDHDHIYWFGDLNYRLMDLNTEQVKNMLNAKAYSPLLEHDQLKVQMGLKNVFVGFTEGDIRHLPTYKYDPGTDNWDSSEKSRPPAWCDRVLWRGGPTKQIVYRSHSKLMISDHKPVSSLFEASIKVIDNVKFRKIYEDTMKKLDKLENEFLPQVTVDKMEVTFDRVSFKDSLVNYLTIANTGQVPVTYEFIKKPNEVSYCKEWLRIKPYTARIMPGDSLDIELEVNVDRTTAPRLNNGDEKLEDIIVLHLDGGKDLFITVNGSYQPSCFGSSIDTLVRLKCPLKDISSDILLKLEQKQYSDELCPIWDIPKELWILVDQLYKYGMLTEDLFQQSGLISEFRIIRNTLDEGTPDRINVSVNSIAEALLIFLEALSEPVIPYNSYERSLECSNNFILCKQVVNELPSNHRNVFYYLIAFLRELLRHSNSNKLDSKILASIFGTIVLRSPENDTNYDKKSVQPIKPNNYNSAQLQSAERKKAAFIFHFLVNDFDI